MKRRQFITICGGGALALAANPSLEAQPTSGVPLEDAFLNPPSTAYAKTWWHWMNGNISEIGITRDLEAMKRVGVGGFQLFEAGTGIPKGPVVYGSPEHLRMFQHAIAEADRLGLDYGMANCPGWSSTGGPWMTARPDLSMQNLTWTETIVSGGKNVSVALKQPQANLNYYRDAMLLAVPAAGEATPVRFTSNSGPVDANELSGTGQGVALAAAGFLQVEFAEPVEARSVVLSSTAIADGWRGAGAAAGFGGFGAQAPSVSLPIEASDDGVQFHKVADFTVPGAGGRGRGGAGAPLPTTANIPATRARFFRVVSLGPRRITLFQISAAPRNLNWDSKAQFTGGRGGMTGRAAAIGASAPVALAGGFIDPNSVLDISQFMNAQGQLSWQAPAGNWTIYRIGHTTNGVTNHPAPDGGTGLEVDKLSAEAYDYHFEQFFGKLLDALAPLAKKGMAGSLIDSYEIGLQNWTPKLPDEFRKRRDYDMKKYMPALFGRVVGSPEITDRFLWDFRKTTAELMNENYYGRFAEDLHARGMKAYNEPYGSGNFDEMQAGSKTDMVLGEFWPGRSPMLSEVKLVASVAHIYGKNLIGAESFTGQTKWQNHPYMLKTFGDYAFTTGLNQLVFHRYAHQPHPDVTPGMTMGPWGWHFDRTNTWFEKASGWLRGYIARSQSLLRQGSFVGDILYFHDEDSPVHALDHEQLRPAPPAGHDWDNIDGPAIQSRVKIENGRITLPGGLSYHVLVLADSSTMTLPLMRKIRDLVNEGMVLVVNSKPQRTPGLTTFADGDADLRTLVAEVWGNLNGTTVTERTFGRGRVFWGQPMRAVLDKIGVKPDFEFTAKAADAPINCIHRTVGDAEVYFVASRRREVEDLVCTFRVSGRQPEFWDAVTGEISKVAVFEEVDGRIRVPLRLERAGSTFVVFRSPAPARRLQEIAKDGAPLVTTRPFTAPAAGLYRNVTNNFTIAVWVKPDYEAVPPVRATLSEPLRTVPVDACPITWAVYPPAGETVYGANHAACGFGAARNGVVVIERSTGVAEVVLTAQVPLAGWTHVAVVYKEGTPSLYVDGKKVGDAAKSGQTVHPGLKESLGTPYYFLGQASEPQLFNEVLSEVRIQQLVAAGLPAPDEPPAFDFAGKAQPELHFWQDGNYALKDGSGRTSTISVSGVGKPIDLTGPWSVKFQEGRGAPPEITLSELKSLHRHEQPGVKYFSGNATYIKKFSVPASAIANERRLYLDLGRVEVVADVKVNGQPAGNVWKPPYRLDITSLVRAGDNDLEVEVANLWPNRLIGDEQLPPEHEYGGGGGIGGGAGLAAPAPGGRVTGPIRSIPEWYAKGQPKPGPRITFATYKWYSKDDPLFESGLLGPVRLRIAIRQPAGA